MPGKNLVNGICLSLSARRAWIEMFGLCGFILLFESLSARRAWIEIIDYIIDYVNDAMSLSARRAWIEIQSIPLCKNVIQSLSARRAWIEILLAVC